MGSWRKGPPVRGNAAIVEGTVIANFNTEGHYRGHAAIYVSQSEEGGLVICDQWVTGRPKPIGVRTIVWQHPRPQNRGDKFFVVD